MIKFIPTLIGVQENPILIIGEKPGKTRDNSTQALVGNRTGDFVEEAIGDRRNIILTNVVNLLYSGKFDRNIGVADGMVDLIELIEEHEPRRIICLGSYAAEYIKSIKTNCGIVELRHPSWINRFHHCLKQDYIQMLQHELDR